MRAAAIVALLALSAPAMACINTYTSMILGFKRDGDAEGVARTAAQAEEAYRKEPSIETANDAAVARILTGKVAEGIQLLRQLEKEERGNAIVAANLGTALELTGEDAEALEWIRESVRRDPKEHFGSEWVHVKILEAKLALKKDPQWLQANSVLGWRQGDPPLRDEKGKPRRDSEVMNAIQYQLFERTMFVSAPDPVVGDLYATLGDLELADTLHPEQEGPMHGHRLAIEYGTVHEARISRINADLARRFDKYIAERDERRRVLEVRAEERRAEQRRRRLLALWVFGSLALVVAGALLCRRRGATQAGG